MLVWKLLHITRWALHSGLRVCLQIPVQLRLPRKVEDELGDLWEQAVHESGSIYVVGSDDTVFPPHDKPTELTELSSCSLPLTLWCGCERVYF